MSSPYHRFLCFITTGLDNAFDHFAETIISPLWAIEFRLSCFYIGGYGVQQSLARGPIRWMIHTSRRRSTWNRCQRRLFSGSIFEGQVRAGSALSAPYALYCSSLKCDRYLYKGIPYPSSVAWSSNDWNETRSLEMARLSFWLAFERTSEN